MTNLDRLNPGQRGRVMGFTVDNPIARRLIELGMVPGKSVIYLRHAPFRDPLEFQVGDSYLSLRRAEASLVTVEVEE